MVLEIEDCGDDRDKAFITGGVLLRLAEYLRLRVRSKGPVPPQLRHLTVVDVIKNTAVKIVHRLPAADDRDSVGATMNLTPDQSRYLVTLVPGEAAVFTDGMDYPVLARMPDGTARETGTPARAAPPDKACGCLRRGTLSLRRCGQGAGRCRSPRRGWPPR